MNVSVKTKTNKREELFNKFGGAEIDGVKFPKTKDGKYNKIYLTKGLKTKIEKFEEEQTKEVVDKMFGELIKQLK